jgi:hypothetical protein
MRRFTYIAGIAWTLAIGGGLSDRAAASALVRTTPAQGTLNNFGSTLGYEFTPASAISVSALGFADLPSAKVPRVGDGLEQPQFVGLWSTSGVLLASATIPAGTAAPLIDGFRYSSLPGSISLAAGRTYILSAYYQRESDDHYTVNNGMSLLATLGQGRFALGQTFPEMTNDALVFGPNLLADDTGLSSRLYEITAGSYIECCGIAGDNVESLPRGDQRFVRLLVDSQRHLSTMTFLGADGQTVFGVVPCPSGDEIKFNFEFGLIFSDHIVFHVDPGPAPYHLYWNYTVSNSPNRLHIDGTLGVSQQVCVDLPTQFSHSNVVAVLVPGSRLAITEFSNDGALLFIQGNPGWTNVIEASSDLVSWTPIRTNLMPYTLCPVCPFILFRDDASTKRPRRFYRCFEIP